jgi:SAM-dependent methyltransferase
MKKSQRVARIARRMGVPLGRRADHRGQVGGQWEKIGALQFQFLVDEGLAPHHHLLDVGCGSLRGGVHFIKYLDDGRYFGIDKSAELLAAGRTELERRELTGKQPTLVQREDFVSADLGQSFDFAVAQSVFTHLTFNTIMRCVAEVDRSLAPGGRFYATFFNNPGPRLRTESIPIRTDLALDVQVDSDPFYYDPSIFSWLCEGSDLECEYRGEWGHPRLQQMLVFTKREHASASTADGS